MAVKSKSESKSKRTHILYDLWLADAPPLERVAPWRETLLAAAEESGATIIDHRFYQFSPRGVTGFLLLAESHLSVHTWPEEGLASVDIFTCGSQVDTDLIYEYIRSEFCAKEVSVMEVKRGTLDLPGKELRHKPMALAQQA